MTCDTQRTRAYAMRDNETRNYSIKKQIVMSIL